MKNLWNKYKEDPYFAVFATVLLAGAATGLINATAHLVGSSGYAVHASKRKNLSGRI